MVVAEEITWNELVQPQKRAAGAFCEIFSVTWCSEQAAVKCLATGLSDKAKVTAAADLRLEIDVLNQMSPSTHVVAILAHGYVTSTNLPFLVMPLLQTTVLNDLPVDRDSGKMWARRVAKKRWPMSRACRLAAELADALDHCHHRAIPGFRVLHRDVKPANLGLNGTDTLILFDFGLASLWRVSEDSADGASEQRTLTANTGSLRYMAPEVARGDKYNHKCDVFSWALILWQMLAHETPYKDAGIQTQVEFISRCSSPDDALRPKLKAHWPAELRDLLTAAWATDPTQRPEMREAVETLRSLAQPSARSPRDTGYATMVSGFFSRGRPHPTSRGSSSCSERSSPATTPTMSQPGSPGSQMHESMPGEQVAYVTHRGVARASPITQAAAHGAATRPLLPSSHLNGYVVPSACKAVPAVAMSLLEAAAEDF